MMIIRNSHGLFFIACFLVISKGYAQFRFGRIRLPIRRPNRIRNKKQNTVKTYQQNEIADTPPEFLSMSGFRNVLSSELDNDFYQRTDGNFMSAQRIKATNREGNKKTNMKLMTENEINSIWSSAMDLEWERASQEEKLRGTKRPSTRPGSRLERTGRTSFLLCYMDNSGISGYERKQQIKAEADRMNRSIELYESPVYNNEDGMCIYATMTASTARKISRTKNGVKVQPLASVLKIRRNSGLSEDDTTPVDSMNLQNIESTDTTSIMVEISPGFINTEQDAIVLSSDFVARIQDDLEADMMNQGRRSLTYRSFLWTAGLVDSDDDIEDFISSSGAARHLSEVNHDGALMWRSLLNGASDPSLGCIDAIEEASVSVEIPSPARNTFKLEFQFVGSLSRECFAAYMAGFATQPEICSVEKLTPFRLFNNYAQWILQSNVVDSLPWYDVGLTGLNQVVAVSDSGLDTDNCYFWDSTSGELKDGTVQSSRRKVVQYVSSFADDGAQYHDHGTHVAGTVAGKKSIDGSTESIGFADGVARDAKISFLDIGVGSGESSQSLTSFLSYHTRILKSLFFIFQRLLLCSWQCILFT